MFIDNSKEGEPVSFDDLHPEFSHFNGILDGLGANAAITVADLPSTLVKTIVGLAAMIGQSTPVLLTLNGPHWNP
jgi:hypothetical protein